jgi:hypothetical protein
VLRLVERKNGTLWTLSETIEHTWRVDYGTQWAPCLHG